MKIGDVVYIIEKTRSKLGLPELEYIITDILEDIEFPVVVKSNDLGNEWREFFNKDEIIKKYF